MRKILASLLFLFCIQVWAAEPVDIESSPVDAFIAELAAVDALEGNFQQQLYDPEGEMLMESSGLFSLLRPGFFSWEIMSPDDQLIIANPEFVWHYDRDLETVTRRPANAGEHMAPLQILGGDDTALREHFQVEGGRGEYILTPINSDAGFQKLRITLGENGPTAMEIDDNLQQKVVIRFSNTARPEALTAADFSFSPPPEADAFYYDE